MRIELEDNEVKTGIWGLLIHLFAWVALCHQRRKHFMIPRGLGYMTFNAFVLTFFYLQCYSLTANTLGDPNSKIIYACFTLGDAFFAWLYTILNDYIHPSGLFGFCVFPKTFFAVAFYFQFDDRPQQILSLYFITSVINYLNGVSAEELLGDCYHEEITEFHTLDCYTLLYLDIPYLAFKCFDGIRARIRQFLDRLQKPRVPTDSHGKTD